MSSRVIQEAKRRVDMRTLVKLDKQRGYTNYVSGRCPFHEDNSPSFMVYSDGWRCLSSRCPRPTGSVLDWILHTRGIDFPTGKEVFALARELVEGIPLARKAPIYTEPLEEGELATISYEGFLRPLWKNLLQYPEAIEYLKNRGFTSEFIKWYRFGLHNESSIAIPVWETEPGSNSRLITCRYRFLNSVEGSSYYGIKDRNQPMLLNQWFIGWCIEHKIETIYSFYGEFDALLALQNKIPAVSPTNGCKSLNPNWFKKYDGSIVLIPDIGEEGDAYKDANSIGIRTYVQELDPFLGKDFTEQFENDRLTTVKQYKRVSNLDTYFWRRA